MLGDLELAAQDEVELRADVALLEDDLAGRTDHVLYQPAQVHQHLLAKIPELQG